jgi:hypothetical protein
MVSLLDVTLAIERDEGESERERERARTRARERARVFITKYLIEIVYYEVPHRDVKREIKQKE